LDDEHFPPLGYFEKCTSKNAEILTLENRISDHRKSCLGLQGSGKPRLGTDELVDFGCRRGFTM